MIADQFWTLTMTAFSTADIPQSINTLEKLAVWTLTVLNDLYINTTAIEATGQAERCVVAGPYYVTAGDPQTWRYICRLSVPLAPTWRRSTKLWLSTQDLGVLAIPADYKAP